jgi:TatD DNase family protein
MKQTTKKKQDRRARRSFTTELKADAVRLVKGGKTVGQVARDLDLTETALREWVRRALELLVEHGAKRVDFHCFGGKVSLARQVADAGFYLCIPANARWSESFTRMLETVPRDRLLLETDCPYLAPVKDRSSEPSDVTHTLAYAAERWQISEAAALTQLEDNFEALFGSRP